MRLTVRTFVFPAVALAVALSAWTSARAEVHQIGATEAEALLKAGGDRVFLLDVRTPGEWARGHIAAAHLIPMNRIPASLSQVPRDKKVVVVCASGARSEAVARFLDEKGYPWVANLRGGVFDWADRGLPLTR